MGAAFGRGVFAPETQKGPGNMPGPLNVRATADKGDIAVPGSFFC